MKMQCENYWHELNTDADLNKTLEEIMHKVECQNPATTVTMDSHSEQEMNVCEDCKDKLDLSREINEWLKTPEGQAALWEDEK